MNNEVYTGTKKKTKYKRPLERMAKAIYEGHRKKGLPKTMAYELTRKEMRKRLKNRWRR